MEEISIREKIIFLADSEREHWQERENDIEQELIIIE
jgi:hypothetical protein